MRLDYQRNKDGALDYGLFLALLLFCFVHADDARPIMLLHVALFPSCLFWRHLFIAGVMFYEAANHAGLAAEDVLFLEQSD
jgi:hypothetical protein